ncbi:GNAT family N-acetyltransferase [Lysobacter sp. HA18]
MSSDVSIRPAQPGDEHALALVGQATFLETFAGVLDGTAIVEHCARAHSATQYRSWLDDGDVAIWLAEVAPGNAPAGYAVVAKAELPGADAARDLELKRIYLLGRYHGGGVGRSLLQHAIMHAREAGASRLLLGVYAGNASAIAFYRRAGFVHVADRRFNVGGRDYDDHVMALPLDA